MTDQQIVEPAPDAVAEAPPSPDAAEADHEAVRPRRWRRGVSWVLTALAALLVGFGLSATTLHIHRSPAALIRLPVEAIVGAALLVVLPARARRVVAALAGAVLGALVILKVIDVGFFAALDRPFDPVLDWPLIGDGAEFVGRSYGRAAQYGAEVAAFVILAALLTVMALAVMRLARLGARYRTPTLRTAAVLAVVWVLAAAFGLRLVPNTPFAAHSAATYAYDRAGQVAAGIRDQQAFAQEATVDAFRGTPPDQFVPGLRGKDVMMTFIESYGRVAIEDPELAAPVDALLDQGTQTLAAAGYHAKSGFLTSPTFGGGSWYAHSTLLSGLWINNQQRYKNLLASDRLTVNKALGGSGWHTVDVEPGVDKPWPEGGFYASKEIYSAPNLGYKGPLFNFSSIPDQYTLSAFQRHERAAAGHQPVFANIVLLSSHVPWAPLPKLVGWDQVGDGSVYKGMPEKGEKPSAERAKIRADYFQSVQYTLSTLISYVQTYGDQNLVMVFLGDHQPAPIVSGEGASRDVPITIVAKDPAVLDRISGWHWQDGLRPGPNAEVWRMDQFRDRFLTAFGTTPALPAAAK